MKIIIEPKDYECLREHLNAIEKIIGGCVILGSDKAPKVSHKETKKQKVNKYKDLIASGSRAKKPNYLKK